MAFRLYTSEDKDEECIVIKPYWSFCEIFEVNGNSFTGWALNGSNPIIIKGGYITGGIKMYLYRFIQKLK